MVKYVQRKLCLKAYKAYIYWKDKVIIKHIRV